DLTGVYYPLTMDSPSILIVDDEKITAFYLKDVLASAGYDAHLAQNGEEALELLARRRFHLVITDLVMPGIDGFALVKKVKQGYPDLPVFILTAHGSSDVARKAQAIGADDYLLKPVNPDQLQVAMGKALDRYLLAGKVGPIGILPEAGHPASAIIGASEPMREVFRVIEKARHSRGNVLIRGESGTGKELVARAIHGGRPGEEKAGIVIVNCCAISEGLIESELFGHARGAFSGAVADRQGLFEIADGGTLFLDEIGDIPLRSQTKLLRILQEGEFRRVGENKVRHVNVRVIAATNRNLEEAVKSGHFREDLYYRLNVIPVHLPPLRSRLSDVPLLVRHFLAKHQRPSASKVGMGDEALESLMDYAFPGNIRELENIVQRAVSLAKGPFITRREIEAYLQSDDYSGSPVATGFSLNGLTFPTLRSQLRRIEREFVLQRLMAAGWNVTDAARGMEITRTALHNRMKKLGIDSKELKGGRIP
ncbi:MAG TPA: sigma-54 dependent transcriptional regulator, partial [Fibrobacteria bacterium]|nr:sigma-54 dependent transcriptional regulator [Fibrobacteria bacterium]